MARIVVLGAGITGLAAAHRILRTRPGADVVVLEAADRIGGMIGATREHGFHVDWAANGVLTNAPDTLELVDELGLELLPSSDRARRRYIFRHGGLRAVPTSPGSFLGSPLLGPLAKLRALAEPFVPARGGAERASSSDDAASPDETVHAFLARRLGTGAADAFADALVTGITAGDPRELSVDALFPRLVALEQEHGSLLRGMMAARRDADGSDPAPPREGSAGDEPPGEAGAATPRSTPATPPAGTTGLATVAGGGMPRLVAALADHLGDRIRTGCRAVGLERRAGEGWRVHVDGAAPIPAAAVVLATPTDVTAGLLQPHAPDAAESLAAIPYAPVRVFGLGYDRIDVPHELDGFGFLPHPDEGLRSLGVLWSSAIFPDRAPPDHVLLRVIAGGSRDAGFVDLPDDAALDAVRDDLRIAMGITVEPAFAVQKRWPRGLPQYTRGHRRRVATAEAACARLGGLVLAGNAYRGVGVNDCVRDANRAADLALAAIDIAA